MKIKSFYGQFTVSSCPITIMAACREPSSLIALRLGILLFTTGQLNCNTQKYRSLIGFWKMKLPVADTGYKEKAKSQKS